MRTFVNEAQRECYEEVAPLMELLYGESAVPAEDVPVFRIQRGSVQIAVAVSAWREAMAAVEVACWVVLRPERSDELHQFLVERNFEQGFGAFAVDPVGDVQFAYRLPGQIVDRVALRAAVDAVLWSAGRFEGEIVARFGGIRPCDAAAAADFERALDEAGLRPSDDQ
jgi:hypothetical protein